MLENTYIYDINLRIMFGTRITPYNTKSNKIWLLPNNQINQKVNIIEMVMKHAGFTLNFICF